MKAFWSKWKEIIIITGLLLFAILAMTFSYKAYAQDATITGWWGVDGTDTNGFAITNVDGNFAALQFANFPGSLQAWVYVDKHGNMFLPFDEVLGDPVGLAEFTYGDADGIIYDYVIFDQRAIDICDNGRPVPIVGAVCMGTIGLTRITQPIPEQE